MYIISTYPLAVAFCLITMLCWGSWANTQKLSAANWRFELFYWDYVLGILLFSLVLGYTLGSFGSEGRSLQADIHQGLPLFVGLAILGGVVFNAANILLSAAISIVGMAVAFPVGIGIALVCGVLVNYISHPVGDVLLLSTGVAFIVLAILLNAYAYSRSSITLPVRAKNSGGKGLLLSVVAGVLMGFFYTYVAQSMFPDFRIPQPGKLSPYTAVFFFSCGVFLSNLIFNSLLMRKPFVGTPIGYQEYFKAPLKVHLSGLLGGSIWCLGMTFSILASGKAGPAISYGLGQGATVVAALWGIFVWKEFKGAPREVSILLGIMLVTYVLGLGLIVAAR